MILFGHQASLWEKTVLSAASCKSQCVLGLWRFGVQSPGVLKDMLMIPHKPPRLQGVLLLKSAVVWGSPNKNPLGPFIAFSDTIPGFDLASFLVPLALTNKHPFAILLWPPYMLGPFCATALN